MYVLKFQILVSCNCLQVQFFGPPIAVKLLGQFTVYLDSNGEFIRELMMRIFLESRFEDLFLTCLTECCFSVEGRVTYGRSGLVINPAVCRF